nr:MAG TPA: hypothetical protein [Caudoviricetes sp.]
MAASFYTPAPWHLQTLPTLSIIYTIKRASHRRTLRFHAHTVTGRSFTYLVRSKISITNIPGSGYRNSGSASSRYSESAIRTSGYQQSVS